MKKLFTLAAVLMLAFSAFAEKVYFKTTNATSWWASDGAKIGALFKVGTGAMDYGVYAAFFTAVEGQTGLFEGVVPENEEPFVAVQFIRYNATATDPEEENYWNATGLELWDGENNMFTATTAGTTWDSTEGTWSKYVPGPQPQPTGNIIYLDCTSFDPENNWSVAGAKMGVMFTDGENTEYTDFMQEGNGGVYYATIPEGNWTSCIFMRYASTATKTGWADFWNRSCEVEYDGSYNKYTLSGWDGCLDERDADQHSDGEWSILSSAEENEADSAVKVQKVMINGQIYLINGDKMYNLLGVEVK